MVGKRQRRSPPRYKEYDCSDSPALRPVKRVKRAVPNQHTALEMLLQAATLLLVSKASFAPPPAADTAMLLSFNGVKTIPRARAKKSHTVVRV